MIEEAQSVLNDRSTAAEPYISWVKEGRKYDLGALLITQQPGSIPNEILSQGDNWFIFHLLSAGDLASAKRANAHFSDDLLSSLLNEPIPGQGVFWSSVGGRPYPVSMRALSFEELYSPADPDHSRSRSRHSRKNCGRLREPQGDGEPPPGSTPEIAGDDSGNGDRPDLEVHYRQLAVKAVKESRNIMKRLAGEGAAWGHLVGVIGEALPETLDDRKGKAYWLVQGTMTALFGERGKGWHTFRRTDTGTLYVRKGGEGDN